MNENKQIKLAQSAIDAGDFHKAIAILDVLVEKRSSAAMLLRSQIGLADENEEAFNNRRFTLLKRAYRLKNPEAAYLLAMHYDVGDMVKKDPKKSLKLLEFSAAHNYPHALWQLGQIHLYGIKGYEKKIELGLSMIKLAAELKSQGALLSIADFYENGEFGYPVDKIKADKIRLLAESDRCLPI
jgi:TPR repeat protein